LFCFVYANASLTLSFKALLSAELSSRILLESGDSLKVIDDDRYEGQFGRILGIAPLQRDFFLSLTSIAAPVFSSKADTSLLMSSGRKCSSHT